jgi:vacuolar-type H+-ATPase subunit H
MIEEVIEEIKNAELQAEKMIEEAKNQAFLLSKNTDSEIAALYERAEIELKPDIQKIIFEAEQRAAKNTENKKADTAKKTELVIEKARSNMDSVQKKIVDAFFAEGE